MNLVKAAGQFALLYVFMAMFMVGMVCHVATILFELAWPVIDFAAKLGVTFGLMGMGIVIVLLSPHIFKLIGVMLLICGFLWSMMAGFI